MNPKTKMKVIIDISMTVLFLILMNLSLTGVLWHEVIGIGILGLFGAHLAVNRQWIKSVANRFTDKIGFRGKAMFVLNAVLLGAMSLTIISGVLVSEYLFPALAVSSVGLWMNLHAVFSWLTLAILVAHTLVHWRWIGNLIKRLILAGGLKVIGARTSLVLIAIATLYSFIGSSALDAILPASADDNSAVAAAAGSASTSTGSTNAVQGTAGLITAPGSVTDNADESLASDNTTVVETKETLQEYLSKLFCTACNKHCPLTSPRCGKGRIQVQAATAKYNASLDSMITFEL